MGYYSDVVIVFDKEIYNKVMLIGNFSLPQLLIETQESNHPDEKYRVDKNRIIYEFNYIKWSYYNDVMKFLTNYEDFVLNNLHETNYGYGAYVVGENEHDINEYGRPSEYGVHLYTTIQIE